VITENFKQSVDFVEQTIRNTPVREHKGVRYQIYENFFDPLFLKDLQEVKSNEVKLSLLQWQEDQNRRRVDYNEPSSKMLQIFFHSSKIINALKEQFHCESLRPKTTDMWFDTQGYQIVPHIDGDYQMQLQIYLNDEDQPPTVLWEKDGEDYVMYDSAKYKSNFGYCLFNAGPSYHGMSGPVVSGERKSIFARFE
tara:strand:+ start:1811 stop:2395 length:585 start_codon:yes stop_codon:yes gene_type:complete